MKEGIRIQEIVVGADLVSALKTRRSALKFKKLAQSV
jgi:hypothetical protein